MLSLECLIHCVYAQIALENMAVMNCRIDKISTKAIHDVGITKFTFEKNM